MRKALSYLERLSSGLVGSGALTLINEIGHRVVSESPRVDVLGMRALVQGYRAAHERPPRGPAIPLMALAADLLGYSAYYGLTARRSVPRGALIGAAAGVVAALVGRALGLNGRQGYHVGRELAMVGFYTAAGVAAALV